MEEDLEPELCYFLITDDVCRWVTISKSHSWQARKYLTYDDWVKFQLPERQINIRWMATNEVGREVGREVDWLTD